MIDGVPVRRPRRFPVTASAISPLRTRIWLPWQAGPEDDTTGPVLVSLTDFTMRSLRFFRAITGTGIRLGLGWYGIPGAVGLFLWADPVHRRTGSVSVWTDRAALRRWVGLPLHVRTMRRNRGRGTLRSTTWSTETFDRAAVRAQAEQRLDAGAEG
jgi:heme-degrading monooxygenase HmoA